MESWLSLTISGKNGSEITSGKATFLIAVPKKVLPLATRRNRMKRLIREAVRGDVFFDSQKVYTFKVRSAPKILNLGIVQKVVNELKTL